MMHWKSILLILGLFGGERCLSRSVSELTQVLNGSYCHPHGVSTPVSTATFRGMEGDLEGFGKGLRLAFVHGVLRHGDRSGMVEVPGTEPVEWECGLGDSLLTNGLKKYHVVPVAPSCAVSSPYSCSSKVTAKSATKGLSEEQLRGSHACGAGELTPRGAEQHVALGEYFEDRYGFGEEGVVAQSTDYGRTALSAASFLHGLGVGIGQTTIGVVTPANDDPLLFGKQHSRCPRSELDVIRTVARRPAPSALFPSLAASPTHPTTPSSLWGMSDGGEVGGSGLVGTARALLGGSSVDATKWSWGGGDATRVQSYRRFQYLPDTLQANVDDLARAGRARPRRMTATELGDIVATRLCHGLSLPCTKEKAPCLPESAALEALRAADREYGARFAGAQNALLMVPALHQILSTLHNPLQPPPSNTTTVSQPNPSSPHFPKPPNGFFRFAHDVVVYPLAAALGIGDGRWPGYASRIVFELWEKNEVWGKGEVEDGGEEESLDGGSGKFVRVLYQGADVTGALPCAAIDAEFSHQHPSTPLCTLQAFTAQIHGLLLADPSLLFKHGEEGKPHPDAAKELARAWTEAYSSPLSDAMVAKRLSDTCSTEAASSLPTTTHKTTIDEGGKDFASPFEESFSEEG